MGKLRIPINRVRLVDVFIVSLVALYLMCFAQALRADVVALPVFTEGGHTTEIVIINVSDAPVKIDLFPGVPIGFEGKFVDLPPKATYRRAAVAQGTGVEYVDRAAGLVVYSVIRTPIGARIQLEPGTARETNWVPDVTDQPGYNAGLLIVAETDSVVEVVDGDAFALKAGQGRIVSASGSPTLILNRWRIGAPGVVSGKLFVWGYENHHATGSLVPLKAY